MPNTKDHQDIILLAKSKGFRIHLCLTEISDTINFYKNGKDYFFDTWPEARKFFKKL